MYIGSFWYPVISRLLMHFNQKSEEYLSPVSGCSILRTINILGSYQGAQCGRHSAHLRAHLMSCSGIIIARYSKTQADASTTAIKTQDVRVCIAGCLVMATDRVHHGHCCVFPIATFLKHEIILYTVLFLPVGSCPMVKIQMSFCRDRPLTPWLIMG